MLLPFQVTMVPAYLTINHLGLMDTVWAVILPGAFSTFPVFVMQRGFDAVPLLLLKLRYRWRDPVAAVCANRPASGAARYPGCADHELSGCLECAGTAYDLFKNTVAWSLSLYLTDTTATWH